MLSRDLEDFRFITRAIQSAKLYHTGYVARTYDHRTIHRVYIVYSIEFSDTSTVLRTVVAVTVRYSEGSLIRRFSLFLSFSFFCFPSFIKFFPFFMTTPLLMFLVILLSVSLNLSICLFSSSYCWFL